MTELPWLARRLLYLTVESAEREFVLADLEEEFRERVEHTSPRAARRWCVSQAIRSALPSIKRRFRRRGKVRNRSSVVFRIVNGVGKDVRYSIRRIIAAPVYSLVILGTVTLGIGALTAVFSVVDAVLIQSLPYPDSEQLVLVHEANQERGGSVAFVSPPNFLDWRDGAREFADVAAMSPGSFVMTADDRVERVDGAHVAAGFFRVLGTQPAGGRVFSEDDEQPGAERVAVVSHGFWVRWFGEDAFVEGRIIRLDDVPRRVVGVLPEAFRYLSPSDIWVPMTFGAAERSEGMRGARYLSVIGRITHGMSVDEAMPRFTALADQLTIHPNNSGWGITLTSLRESAVREVRAILLLLFGAVIFVLMIMCANVAALVMGRATGSWREFALRRALGAGNLRLFRQSIVEQTILAGTGAILGAGMAALLLDRLLRLIPNPLPTHVDVGFSGITIILGLSAALGTAIVLGTASLLVVFRVAPSHFLRSGASVGQSRTVLSVRNGLIVAEIALSIVLLIGATLFARSFVKLRNVDLGFEPAAVFNSHVNLPSARYAAPESKVALARNLTQYLESQAGVESAAITTNLPMSGSSMNFGYRVEDAAVALDEHLSAQYHAVSERYFETIGIPFRFGSSFPAGAGASPVVIVNESLARRVWGAENPVGRSVTVISQNGPVAREVVGVIADVRHADPMTGASDEVYVPFSQDPWSFFAVVVKGEGGVPSGVITAAVQTGVTTLDPAMPPPAVQPLDDVVAQWRAPLRFQMTLVGAFALMALCLAAIGIYGVIAYFVGGRVREIGLRIAIGAGSVDILSQVVLRSLALASVGVGLGVGLSVLLSRSLTTLLYDVAPFEPLTYVAVSVLMLIVAGLAAFLPARRASRINPVDALRVT